MGLRNRNKFTNENCFFITTSCFKMKHLLFDEDCHKIIIENFKKLFRLIFKKGKFHYII